MGLEVRNLKKYYSSFYMYKEIYEIDKKIKKIVCVGIVGGMNWVKEVCLVVLGNFLLR